MCKWGDLRGSLRGLVSVVLWPDIRCHREPRNMYADGHAMLNCPECVWLCECVCADIHYSIIIIIKEHYIIENAWLGIYPLVFNCQFWFLLTSATIFHFQNSSLSLELWKENKLEKKVNILMSLEVKYHLTKANVWPKGRRYFCHWKWTFHGEILKSFLLILSNSISFSYPVIIRSWDGVSPGFFFPLICLQESLLQIRPMLTRKINTIRCIFFCWLRLNAEACFWALLRWK